MAVRALKVIGFFGLGAALIVSAALFLGWPPLAARSPEVIFTVVDQPEKANLGRAAVLDFAERNRFKLLGNREEALNPDTLSFHHLFRLDSHIFVSRGFRPDETRIDFRRSIFPMSRSADDVRLLGERFRQDMTSAGFAVEVLTMD